MGLKNGTNGSFLAKAVLMQRSVQPYFAFADAAFP
jgi:hypothetical protein